MSGPASFRAFPSTAISPECGGMTLRDWFAGQWLAGMLAGGQQFESPEAVADEAFAVADAMLAERERQS